MFTINLCTDFITVSRSQSLQWVLSKINWRTSLRQNSKSLWIPTTTFRYYCLKEPTACTLLHCIQKITINLLLVLFPECNAVFGGVYRRGCDSSWARGKFQFSVDHQPTKQEEPHGCTEQRGPVSCHHVLDYTAVMNTTNNEKLCTVYGDELASVREQITH